MIPVTQSRVGPHGRCFPACLASILEIPESAVPDFGSDNEFLDAANRFLDQFGLYYVQVDPVGETVRHAMNSTGRPIYHTVEGQSPRGGMHAVVGRNGIVVHDPHPEDGTGRGLVRVDCFGLLCARVV